MMSRSIFITSLLALVLVTHAYAGDSVEKLAGATALGEVSDSPGVVLVDLYADW